MFMADLPGIRTVCIQYYYSISGDNRLSGREVASDRTGCFFEPSLALLRRAGDDHRKAQAVEAPDAAQPEDAVLPDCFEWVSEHLQLPFGEGVGGVEYQRNPGLQEPHRRALA